jgi:hypothetical protein
MTSVVRIGDMLLTVQAFQALCEPAPPARLAGSFRAARPAHDPMDLGGGRRDVMERSGHAIPRRGGLARASAHGGASCLGVGARLRRIAGAFDDRGLPDGALALARSRPLKRKGPRYGGLFCSKLAEREGFEPPVPCGTTAFETAALNRSATSPGLLLSGTQPFDSARLSSARRPGGPPHGRVGMPGLTLGSNPGTAKGPPL